MNIFDLITVIKDTEKPIILSNNDHYEKYSFRELALDSETLRKSVKGVRVDNIEGRPCYLIKIRG